MSIRQRYGLTLGPALRLAGLLVVLGGLFGMHGLADDGTGGMEMAPYAAMSDMTMASQSAKGQSAATSLVDHVQGGLAQAAVAVSYPSDVGMDMDMADMCVAALAGGLLALVILLLSSLRGPLLWLQRRRVRVVARPGRAPDPTSLFVLSIQRC